VMGRDAILARLASGVIAGAAQGVELPTRLCRSAVNILECDGGAITFAYTRPERVTLCTTDDTARQLEDLQDVLGEGPGATAFEEGTYHCIDLVPDALESSARWPIFEDAALQQLGALRIHALPMQPRTRTVGVLTLYQRQANGDLQVEDARFLSDAVGAALLADAPTQHEAGQGPWTERAQVHQATGMVVAQLGIGTDDALALMRAHAYSHNESLSATAHQIVTRVISFTESTDQGIEST
jgi:ANTAR domain